MSVGPSVGRLLDEARRSLAASAADTSPREALLLLGDVLELDEARLRARPEREVANDDAARFRELIARRATGEPVAYLLGRREFYGREFLVDERVLVPRPETEHLVEHALGLIDTTMPRILDIGSGSGCIGLTLACELETARVVATDVSPGAIAVTRANARALGVGDRVRCVGCDVADAVRLDAVDLLVSNPPYIDPEAAETLPVDVREHEPHAALFADDAGRAVVLRIFDAAASLRAGVHVLLEIGHDQGRWIRDAVTADPSLELVELLVDYGGHERVAVLRRR